MMNRVLGRSVLLVVVFQSLALGGPEDVKLVHLRGEVKIRRGLDEHWQRASFNETLRDVDTILALEDAEAVLELSDGSRFTLGANSIMDVGDLRKITERDLFLFLMSHKVGTLRQGSEEAPPGVTNVSVVRASNRSQMTPESTLPDRGWVREKNGARALFAHEYVTSAILKLHKMFDKAPAARHCAEAWFLLGEAFSGIQAPGRAREAYRQVVAIGTEDVCRVEGGTGWAEKAESALLALPR